MSAKTLRRAHGVRRRHVAFISRMHAYFLFWSPNPYSVNLVCRGLDFADLVLVNLSGPNLPFFLDMLS